MNPMNMTIREVAKYALAEKTKPKEWKGWVVVGKGDKLGVDGDCRWCVPIVFRLSDAKEVEPSRKRKIIPVLIRPLPTKSNKKK